MNEEVSLLLIENDKLRLAWNKREDEVFQLREENARLKDAVDWFLAKGWMCLAQEAKDGVFSRAFPPAEEWEEVEVKRWECCLCGYHSKFQSSVKGGECCKNSDNIIELTGTRRIRKTPKVKRREEINPNVWPVQMKNDSVKFPKCDGVKFFAEWIEE